MLASYVVKNVDLLVAYHLGSSVELARDLKCSEHLGIPNSNVLLRGMITFT